MDEIKLREDLRRLLNFHGIDKELGISDWLVMAHVMSCITTLKLTLNSARKLRELDE